ncbi:MAG: dimethylarginine dimethylaminohydrolase family protein [Gemmatimonadota bacterium]
MGTLRRVLLKHPRQAFVSEASIQHQWRDLGYGTAPDLARASREHDRFAKLLHDLGISVEYLPEDPNTGLDSLYARDAGVSWDGGLILCRMAKAARRGEVDALRRACARCDIRIRGEIRGGGTLEGGDVAWLDDRTVAVGRGYRTNTDGVRQFRRLLADSVEEVIEVPLPHWRGPGDVFHLMSIVSPIDRDLILVYSPLLPIPFRERLLKRGFELVEVPEVEFPSMGANVLAVAPRRCVMLQGNPETRRRLELAGARVRMFVGDELCHKGSGGPTCLVRPLVRDPL